MRSKDVKWLKKKLKMIGKDLSDIKELRDKTAAELGEAVAAESGCPLAIGEVFTTWNGIDAIVKSVERGVSCKWVATCCRADGRGYFKVSSNNYAATLVDRDTYDISDYTYLIEKLTSKSGSVGYHDAFTFWKLTHGDDEDSVERYRVSERVAKHREVVLMADGKVHYPYPDHYYDDEGEA